MPHQSCSMICDLFDNVATRYGERISLVWCPEEGADQHFTLNAIRISSIKLASALMELGLSPGDLVFVCFENSLDMIISILACAYAGLQAVLSNPGLTEGEIYVLARKIGAPVALTDDRFLPKLQSIACWLVLTPESALRHSLSSPLLPRVSSSATAVILFTSGSTSEPKGVEMSHSNLLFGAQVSALHAGLSSRDVSLVHLPLHHVNGLVYSFFASVYAGAVVVLMRKFSVSRFWDIAFRHKCTWTSMIQFCVRALLASEKPKDHTFRGWAWGMADSEVDRYFGLQTLSWYGMTETVSHPLFSDQGNNRPNGTMGKCALEYKVRIVRVDGSVASVDEAGELQISGLPGVSLFKSYFNDTAATLEAFTADKWFRTGDQVTKHESGYFSFVGRSHDILRVGGENVSCFEIESIIGLCEEIVDVAVIGRKHEVLGEVPIAFLTLKNAVALVDGTRSIKIFLVERLAHFKRPVEVHILKEIPKLGSSKNDKRLLRQVIQSDSWQRVEVRASIDVERSKL